MRVSIVPADLEACGTYRMAWPAEAVQLARPDWDVQVHNPLHVQVNADRMGNVTGVRGIPPFKEIDLLVVQRVGAARTYNLLKWAHDEGCAVVMDSDDAMWSIDRDNVAWQMWNGPEAPNSWKWTDEAAKLVDGATVTTPYLARRYGPRVSVVPNCVPNAIFSVASERDDNPTPTLGWAGFVATHPKDLKVVGESVQNIVRDILCRVVALPDKEGLAKAWNLPPELIESYGPFQLGRPYFSGLTRLDIALVPLADTPFNHGKSYLKALECAAVGSSVIASPTPANRLLARTVPICLASTPREWYEHMVRLLNDPAERAERAEAGRKAIAEKHTLEVNGHRWADVWERAVARRRRLDNAR